MTRTACIVMVALVAPAVARAGADPVAELATAIAIPALQRAGRVAIVASGQETPEASTMRATVAAAFARAGHATVLVGEPIGTREPERALLSKLWTEQRASSVAVVRISTPFERGRASVVLYDLGGAPLFEAYANRAQPGGDPVPIWTAWPMVDPKKLPGQAFYEEIGRNDLARSYRRRAVTKTLVRVGGIVAAAVWLGWTMLELMAAIDSDYHPAQSLAQKLLLTGSAAMIIVPSFISTDPLSADEREALVGGNDRWARRVSLGGGPLPGGGALSLTGSF
jgi:hypothetical protein